MLKTLQKNILPQNFRNIIKIAKRHNCDIPKIVMNNGYEMPVLGFGTWSANVDYSLLEKDAKPPENKEKRKEEDAKNTPEFVGKSVAKAINYGYRHIDCAHLYKNQKEIGKHIKKAIKSGDVTREDLFIVSKLWNNSHNPENVCQACKQTLDDFGLDYLDMYLMHSPMGFEQGEELFPTCDGKLLYSDADYVDTWKAMEELIDREMCRSIGISNFNIKQIERLLSNCSVVPQTLQIEVHPYLTQKDLTEFCKCQDICITAYAPLGSPRRPWTWGKEKNLLQDETVMHLAERHKKTPAQILLRYQVQLGHAVIPKSTSQKRIEENFNIFDFELCPEDMQNLNCLDHDMRYFKFSGAAGHQHHPFEKTCWVTGKKK